MPRIGDETTQRKDAFAGTGKGTASHRTLFGGRNLSPRSSQVQQQEPSGPDAFCQEEAMKHKNREDFWPVDDDRWSDEELHEALVENRRKFHRPFWDRQPVVIA
jgi:hypothetical protein